ncbi:MAG: hypothetical protein MUE44_01140 [Oscillatoriaceae cyanobacterium Prado104]|nr:hypothetical protein [Oscillatoriaceae cyanobacterium Prado104]
MSIYRIFMVFGSIAASCQLTVNACHRAGSRFGAESQVTKITKFGFACVVQK